MIAVRVLFLCLLKAAIKNFAMYQNEDDADYKDI